MVDQQTRNGSFNGSFLVLNLGTNTLEVGKSFTQTSPSESTHQIPKDTNPSPPIPNESNNAFDTISSSAQEGSFSTSETSITKRGGSEEADDPNWVPEKKARKSSSSGNRTVKAKQGPSVSSYSPQISLGGFSGMLNSSSGLPPPHLIGLLTFFGWKVVFQPDKGDYVYISPIGLPYSLPKAFESLLQGSSKYSEKAGVSSCYLESSSTGVNLVQRAAASSSYLSVGSDTADVSRKKRGGRRKKTSNVEENTNLFERLKEKLSVVDDSLTDNGKQPLQTAEGLDCRVANHASSLCKINEKAKCYAEDTCLSNEYNWDSLRDGNVSGVKRSGRMRGRHVPVDHEMNVLSGPGVFEGEATNKEQTPTSQSENMLKKRLEACKTGKASNNEVRNLNCCAMDVMRSGQSSWRSKGKARRSAGLRRSGRLNKQNDVLDRDLDKEKQVVSSFSVSAIPVTKTDARKGEGKSLVPECMLDEKSYCSTSHESLDGATKRSDSGSAFLLSESDASDTHGCHDATGIRRSMRINGKHVPVDDDLDVEIGFDDYLLYPSEFGDSIVVKMDREKPRTSTFEVDDMEGKNPGSDDLPKRKNMNNSCCKKSGFAKSSASSEQKPMKFPGSKKCSSSFAAEGKLVSGGNFNRKNKKKRRGGCGLTVRRNQKDDHQEENLSQTKLNILSWLIDSGTLTENERIDYITKNSTTNTPGFVTRRGIWCNCCKELVPLSKFVAHAGGKVQQPWDNIFLLSGKTLTFCLKEAWEREKTQKKVGFRTVGVGDPDPSDDTCGICADGGHLICCDSCPSTFHQTCLMLKTLPEGSWYCPYCICTFCMAVVRRSDMPLEGLNLLSCKHCGRKYHKNCAWGDNMNLMGSAPFSFCGKNCQKVATELLGMLGITNPMEEGFSWILLKHFDEDAGIISNQRLSSIMESNVKLSMALSVLDECFVPLIDQRTGVDMLCQAVYNCGSNFNRLNYEGFYTLILEKDEEIISAASLRLHGMSLAEMPFIGTRPIYRRQGMCRRLLKAVENILCRLHVEKLIIPAIPDMLETWTKSFSFKPLEPSHREEVKNLSLMVFAETTLVQKSMNSIGAFVQEDVVPDNSVSCKNVQENIELQRSFGDQINTRSHVGSVENLQVIHELQTSVGDQISTRNRLGSGKIILKSHEPQSSFGDQINTTSHFGRGNNIQETHELQTCFADEKNIRTDLVGNGSIHGKNIQGSHELQRSFGDQINTRNHFGSGNSIHENFGLQKSFADPTITRSHLVDKGHSYRGNIQCSHEAQKISADQITPIIHCGIWKNVQESHVIQRSFADQISSRCRVDNCVSHVKNIQDSHGLQRSSGNQLTTGGHPGSGNNIQKNSEVQRSFGDQINNSGNVGFQKNIQQGHGGLRSSNDQINNANHFGGAPDWWFYECMLKGQADSASDPRGNFKDSSITPDSLAILPRNLSNGSISEASPSRHTCMRNLSAVPHNHTSVSHDSLAIQPPNIPNGSISEASPFQCTSMENLCSVPQNPTTSTFPDSLPILPPNIPNGSIFEALPLQSTFATNLITISHNFTASDTPAPLASPNIPNGSISEASPVDCTVMQNLSAVPRNPATTSYTSASIDVVLDSNPLCVGSIAAPNIHMNSQSQGDDAVKNLQMEAIRSSISFDNLFRAIS